MMTKRFTAGIGIRKGWSAWVAGAVLGAMIVAIPALGEDAPASAPAAKPAQWTQKMQELRSVFQELLVDLSSDDRYNDPANRKRIERNTDKLARAAHSLVEKGAPTPADRDPSIPLFAKIFDDEAQHAQLSLQWGQRAYARNALRALSGYCVACHTRNGSGPQFSGLEGGPAAKDLRPLERADYFTAIRAYDQALGEYERIAGDRKASADAPLDWEKAVRNGIGLAVRVKNDPNRAMALVNQVIEDPSAPHFLKEQARRWRESIVAWKKEKRVVGRDEASLYAETKRLIRAAEATQKYPADRAADILYLRAGARVHELLAAAPNGRHVTEALHLAGLSYEALQNPRLGEIHEFYYLACIQREPHSALSRECFRRYEASVYAGYTGSSGTHLPVPLREKLDELDRLSLPAGTEIKKAPGKL